MLVHLLDVSGPQLNYTQTSDGELPLIVIIRMLCLFTMLNNYTVTAKDHTLWSHSSDTCTDCALSRILQCNANVHHTWQSIQLYITMHTCMIYRLI